MPTHERPSSGQEPPWRRRRFGSGPYWRGPHPPERPFARPYERPEVERPRETAPEEPISPFEIFRPGGPRRPERREEPRREEPRREAPRKPTAWYEYVVPEEAAEAPMPPERFRTRPIEPRWRDIPRGRPRLELARFFPDLESIWRRVQRIREDPRWKASPQAGILEISPASEDRWMHAQNVADFLGIPRSELEKYRREDIWNRLLGPLLEELSAALNAQRPRGLPGEFVFGFGPSNAFGLIYVER